MLSFSNDVYVPKSTLKQQEFQKNKLAEDFKKLKKPIKPKLETKTVNTVLTQIVQKPTAKRYDILPKAAKFEEKKYDILPKAAKVEEKNDLDSYKKFVNPYISTELKKMICSPPIENINEPVVVFTSSNKNNPFLNGYLADCGFMASWSFKCAPYKPLPICVENRSDGAWVPFIIQYNEEYMLCSDIKNGNGRQFSQDYGNAYR
jgi:hypothetical protein